LSFRCGGFWQFYVVRLLNGFVSSGLRVVLIGFGIEFKILSARCFGVEEVRGYGDGCRFFCGVFVGLILLVVFLCGYFVF